MKTATINTLIEAAQILKKSNWTYEYCHPETVSEAYMSDAITALELNINRLSDEQLAKAIVADIDKWDAEDEVADKDAKEIAEFVADGVAHSLVEPLPYETVTFKFH